MHVRISCCSPALLCSTLLLSRPRHARYSGCRRTLEARLVTEATGSAILQLRSSMEEEESRYRVLDQGHLAFSCYERGPDLVITVALATLPTTMWLGS